MSPVIAVLGAGTGLGTSVARRFGREGYRVALVGRRFDRLEKIVSELAADGVESAAFSADLSTPTNVATLMDSIRERFGRIDVVEYGPVDADTGFVAAADLDAPTLQSYLDLFTLTPVEVIRAVLPEMRERGSGAILVTHGASAVTPWPFMSGPGPAMSASRSILYSLSGELDGTGVYVGTIAVAAVIERSEGAERAAESGDESLADFPTVDPDVLADLYWDMNARRDQIEQVYPS